MLHVVRIPANLHCANLHCANVHCTNKGPKMTIVIEKQKSFKKSTKVARWKGPRVLMWTVRCTSIYSTRRSEVACVCNAISTFLPQWMVATKWRDECERASKMTKNNPCRIRQKSIWLDIKMMPDLITATDCLSCKAYWFDSLRDSKEHFRCQHLDFQALTWYSHYTSVQKDIPIFNSSSFAWVNAVECEISCVYINSKFRPGENHELICNILEQLPKQDHIDLHE